MALPKTWPAPAKLNLMLRVTGRRPDGYHLLQTVFQFLDYYDYLTFTPRSDGHVRRLVPLPGVREEEDLTVRAARLLQKQSGTSLGVDISLEKRLPSGGGLGGGSSDAATTLVALNRLWGCGMSGDELSQLGLKLGADVPVFVLGRAAWGEGVGEALTPLVLPEPWYMVLIPPCRISTEEVFSHPELTRNSPRMTIRDFLDGGGGNDCLSVVSRSYPPVAEGVAWLARFGEPRLTGTGACIFASFVSEAAARDVLTQIPKGYQGFVAKGMNRSPVPDLAGV